MDKAIEPDRAAPKFSVTTWFPLLKPYSMCEDGYQGGHCEGWITNYLDDKPLRYKPTAGDLSQLSDEQKKTYARLYDGYSNMSLPLTALMFARNGILRLMGKAAGKETATFREISDAYRNATGTIRLANRDLRLQCVS